MKTKALAAVLILCGFVLGTESKYILNAKRLSSAEEAISCSNGADPTGHTIGGVLIISCGKYRPS